MNPTYPRYSKASISEALTDTPVVFIAGPRQSGKATLAKSLISPEWCYITLDDQAQLTIAKSDPAGFIKNLPENQRIVIDEIQRLPELLITIKQVVDEHRMPGRFLLTGSSNALLLPQVSDSLAGRIETIFLNPLSECEIKGTQPSFLSKLLNGKIPATQDIRIRDYLIKRIVTGCFPEPLQRTSEQRVRTWYKQYINALIQKDIKDITQIDHPEKMMQLLKLTSFYSAKLINFSELGEKLELDRHTIKKYLGLLEQLFLLKPLPAWHSNEYKRLIKAPKLHITDTGLISATRDLSEESLRTQPHIFGSLLETFVINELKKQAAWLDRDITFYHYRDKDKREVDCVIEDADQNCFGIEIKAAATLNPKDFSGLVSLRDITKKRFKLGVLLYDGDETINFDKQLLAIPIGALWA